MRVTTLPSSPCHYASASLSPLPSVSPPHGASLVKPLSSSSSHLRATSITSSRRSSPFLARFSAIDTPAELPSELKVMSFVQLVVPDELFMLNLVGRWEVILYLLCICVNLISIYWLVLTLIRLGTVCTDRLVLNKNDFDRYDRSQYTGFTIGYHHQSEFG